MTHNPGKPLAIIWYLTHVSQSNKFLKDKSPPYELILQNLINQFLIDSVKSLNVQVFLFFGGKYIGLQSQNVTQMCWTP